jgi:hypothetical protein
VLVLKPWTRSRDFSAHLLTPKQKKRALKEKKNKKITKAEIKRHTSGGTKGVSQRQKDKKHKNK